MEEASSDSFFLVKCIWMYPGDEAIDQAAKEATLRIRLYFLKLGKIIISPFKKNLTRLVANRYIEIRNRIDLYKEDGLV